MPAALSLDLRARVIAARPVGGDRHSHRVEAHGGLILQTLEDRPQVYLREVQDASQQYGAVVSLSGLSRFFRRHGITRKKGGRDTCGERPYCFAARLQELVVRGMSVDSV